MSLTISVITASKATSLQVRPEDTVKSVKKQLVAQFQESITFANTPLPAPMLTLRGTVLNDDSKFGDLRITPTDHFMFLFPLVDPEPSRNRPVAQWRRSEKMDVDASSTSTGSMAATLDNVLATLTGRAPAFPSENREALASLMEMGFSESRCKKALMLNDMDVEAALNWLCAHIEDPDIDDPLNPEQMRQVDAMMRERAQRQTKENAENKVKKEKEELEACLALNTCTYAYTGPKMVHVTEYFICHTCGLDNNMGCCGSCSSICHAGHVLVKRSLPTGSPFYCDCPEAGYCKCCPAEYMPKK